MPFDGSATDFFGKTFQVGIKDRLLRDPVHGLIPIDESSDHGRLLLGLIDSAEVQRLRRIRQLGLACYVFQGAEHTRFAHSIGAMHLMRNIFAQLNRMYTLDSELMFYAQIAALLHDIGHGPFSHVWERVFEPDHETWTLRILHDPETEVNRLLTGYNKKLPSIIESILTGMAKPGYLSMLLSSELDVDRLDYLMRDSLMTGVKYGVYDLDRLLHVLRISPDGERIMVCANGLVPVEKYLQARYHMHRQVYRHKTVVAVEAMMGSILRRARNLSEEGDDLGLPADDILLKIFRRGDMLFASDYFELDDFEIWARIKHWARGGDPILSDLSRRLLNRQLFKTLEVHPDSAEFEARLGKARELVSTSGLDPNHYLIQAETSDTPYRAYDPSYEHKLRQIWIEDAHGKIIDVAQMSPSIQAFTHSAYCSTRMIFPETHNGVNLRSQLTEILAPEDFAQGT